MKNDLTEGVVWKKLLRFFFPILFGLLFQQLYNTVDAVIVGHFVGDSALAAVGGSASVIINTILGFFTGINSGATVLISQRYGAKDDQGLSRVLHTSIVLCLGIGLAITVGGYFIAPWALKLIGNPEDIMEASTLYLRVYFVGSVPLLLYNLFQGTLQGVGDSRRPLIYLISSCVTNIFLDLLFVGAFGWGVAGVGWASVLSMVLCTLLALNHLTHTDGPHRIQMRKLRFEPAVLKDTLPIGLPSGLQGSMYNIANMIIQAAVNSFGTATAAAWTATSKLDGFYWVTSNAFGVAICAFVGQCYGAGKLDRMHQAIRIGMKIALGTTVVLSVFLLAIAKSAYGLFLNDEGVIDQAVFIMWHFVPAYFLWTFIDMLSGTFRGVGDTFRPMIITLVGTCIFRVVWMLGVVPRWHTITMVSLAFGISWALTGGAYIVYYLSGKWLKKA